MKFYTFLKCVALSSSSPNRRAAKPILLGKHGDERVLYDHKYFTLEVYAKQAPFVDCQNCVFPRFCKIVACNV